MNNEKGISRNSTGLEIGKSKILVPAVGSTSLVTLASPLSALSFPIWKRGRFGGEKGGCSISPTADENGGLLWCRVRTPSLKTKQKQPFDSLSTSSEKKRPNDANQSPSASITTTTK